VDLEPVAVLALGSIMGTSSVRCATLLSPGLGAVVASSALAKPAPWDRRCVVCHTLAPHVYLQGLFLWRLAPFTPCWAPSTTTTTTPPPPHHHHHTTTTTTSHPHIAPNDNAFPFQFPCPCPCPLPFPFPFTTPTGLFNSLDLSWDAQSRPRAPPGPRHRPCAYHRPVWERGVRGPAGVRARLRCSAPGHGCRGRVPLQLH
jgi:hypothetical protein